MSQGPSDTDSHTVFHCIRDRNSRCWDCVVRLSFPRKRESRRPKSTLADNTVRAYIHCQNFCPIRPSGHRHSGRSPNPVCSIFADAGLACPAVAPRGIKLTRFSVHENRENFGECYNYCAAPRILLISPVVESPGNRLTNSTLPPRALTISSPTTSLPFQSSPFTKTSGRTA
jgi:hypothetical protein